MIWRALTTTEYIDIYIPYCRRFILNPFSLLLCARVYIYLCVRVWCFVFIKVLFYFLNISFVF